MKTDYSVDKISKSLLEDIVKALKNIGSYGSVEIFIQKGVVTQITTRNIKKTTSHRSS